MKNWEPLVLGPALAMERSIGFSCFRVKASSARVSWRVHSNGHPRYRP